MKAVQQEKEHLRRLLLAERKQLSIKNIAKNSHQAFELFIQHQKQLVQAPNKRIGLYAPIQSELDTALFLEHFLKNGFKVHFPRIEKNEICFYQISGAHQLSKGTFQVPEPPQGQAAQIPETIFVPGLGFDPKTGSRLGFGKGYYDRFFSTNRNTSIRKIGLSYDFQTVHSFQSFPTDVCMDFVLTESRLMKFAI